MEQKALVSVTFTGSASPYHEGDVAGFPASEARQYIDKGVAEYTDEEDAKAAAPAPPPVATVSARVKAAAKAGATKSAGEQLPPDGAGKGAGEGSGAAQ